MAARIERRESRGATAADVLQYRGYCSRLGLRGEREPAAGRVPTVGQEEMISFLILA